MSLLWAHFSILLLSWVYILSISSCVYHQSCCALLLSISSRLCFLCFHFVNIIPLANSYCNILLLSCVYKHKINILSISSRLRILIASSKQHPTIWQQRALKRAHCKKAKLSKKTYFDYSCPLYSNILSPVFKYIVPCIQIYDAVQWHYYYICNTIKANQLL